MGENKALLPIADTPMLERVLHSLQPFCAEVLLITNTPDPYRYLDLPLIADIMPGYGPLMGLYSGLRAASHDLTLLLACDMPFVNTALLTYLLDLVDGYDVVVPRTGDGLHPLCAVYRRSSCLVPIEDALKARKRRMIAFFEEVRVREIEAADVRTFDPAGIALMNINTPEELAAAQDIAP